MEEFKKVLNYILHFFVVAEKSDRMSSKSIANEKIVCEVGVRGMWDGSDLRRKRSSTEMV